MANFREANKDIYGKCDRCATPIKYVYTHNGKAYGSTCIQRVSGINPNDYVWKDGQPNEEATKIKQSKNTKQNAYTLEASRLHKENMAATQAYNHNKYEDLIRCLHQASKYEGDFCDNIRNDILEATAGTVLDEDILSPNVYQITREIWAKQTGGRKNSKAYKEALVIFDESFG